MENGKRLLLDRHAADAARALGEARALLSKQAPTTLVLPLSIALDRASAALTEVRVLLEQSAEERERAAATPDEDWEDLLAWAQAGRHRARWLLNAYSKIEEYVGVLLSELPPPLVREMSITQAKAAQSKTRDEAAGDEGNEAVTALERAITCLQALSKEAQETPQRHTKWAIREYDLDEHGIGCKCVLCNSNGHSWGTAIYDVAALDQELIEAEDSEALSAHLRHMNPVKVVYAAQPETSESEAEAWVEQHGGWYGQEKEEAHE